MVRSIAKSLLAALPDELLVMGDLCLTSRMAGQSGLRRAIVSMCWKVNERGRTLSPFNSSS
jgi:hypothetical protein